MKQVELIMVSSSNNNKYYKMNENSDNTFTVRYGRVGVTETIVDYPMSKWQSLYNSKIKKGYKDVTSLKVVSSSKGFKDVSDSNIMTLLNSLQKYSKQSIITNYTVSSETVTQVQIDKAQDIIDEITKMLKKKNIINEDIDDKFLELYTIIPRRMKNTKDFILNGDGDKQKAKEIVNREQNALDVMRGQVSISSNNDNEDKTLEDVLGVKIALVKDNEVIEKIKKMMGQESNKFKRLFEVTKFDTQKTFDEQRKKSTKHWTRLLWHGSRNENWLNILKTGLKIRPAGSVLTGAMFGYGQYFADKCRKSVGYTSLSGSYWAGGNARQAFLALFEVNTGMEYRVDKHNSSMYTFDYKKLRSKGEYDSLFAKGGIDLVNNEYIVYKESQCTIKYLVEIGE